jgi:hypothetical protein
MAARVVHGNLDCEARWAKVTLPLPVRRRISAAAALMTALLEDLGPQDEVELWTPTVIDPPRVRHLPRLISREGAPPRADLAWAADTDAARVANDRRTALAIAVERGVALPGATFLTDRAALLAHLATGGADASPERRWVIKAPWTAAGRDRYHGAPGGLPVEDATRIDRLFARFGGMAFEPWMVRTLDLGVCATVAGGRVTARAPHTLRSDARGGFVGIDLAPPPLSSTDRDLLDATVEAVGARLGALGYAGPFTVDAFVHDVDGQARLYPLCEINARHSFGGVAHALAATRGARALGFGPPPAGAEVLLAPAPDDPIAAWITR